MTPLPLLIRAAVRLADFYSTRVAKVVETALHERLADYQRHLTLVGEVLRQAVGGNQQTDFFALNRRLRGLVEAVEKAVRPTAPHLLAARTNRPDLRSLLAELRQLDNEFGGLEIDLRQETFRVETERIVLEGIDLGPFAIVLDGSKLLRQCSSSCFDIEALDACPASRDEDTTHPHVHKGVLCAGDATVPIQHALEAGRLADAFLLVQAVLTHYNPASPHVALEDWDRDEDDQTGCCGHCGCRASYDDLGCCSRCGSDYCSDCLGSCDGCNNGICSSCEVGCGLCGKFVCPSCVSRCRLSGKNCCKSCRLVCPACGDLVANDCFEPTADRCSSCAPKTKTESPIAMDSPV